MAKNPSEMTDKELDEAIANPPEEGLIPPVEVEVKPEEKKPDEKPAPKEEEKPEPEKEEEIAPETEEEEEEEKPISRREALRVQDLLARGVTPVRAKAPVAPEAMDYEKALDADPELIAKLKADREASNTAMYQQGIEQANSIRFHTRLEIDAPRIEAKYPQLDSSSSEFKPEAAKDINTLYLSLVGYNAGDPQKGVPETVQNPNLRYSDFVESILGLSNDLASEKAAETTAKVIKQAAQTGLRPDGSTTKKLNLNKLPEQMTDEELDARIALAIPPSQR